MSKKYVIEIKPEYEDTTRGIMVLGVRDSNLYADALAVEDLEELNSDYINEHFSELQDTIYKKGLHDGESKCRYCNEYQRGLDDAWEAAEKIVCDETLGMSTLMHIFNRGTLERIFKDIPPAEAIEKLKAYEEQKADEEVEVGDEVTDIQSGANFLVTHLWESNHGDKGVSGFNTDCYAFSATLDKVSKTGRHFDIEEILEAMKA